MGSEMCIRDRIDFAHMLLQLLMIHCFGVIYPENRLDWSVGSRFVDSALWTAYQTCILIVFVVLTIYIDECVLMRSLGLKLIAIFLPKIPKIERMAKYKTVNKSLTRKTVCYVMG